MRDNMLRYIGTQVLNAQPMALGEYNQLRGWEIPANENPEESGYLVEYLDGGKANASQFEGRVSWSTADVFERAYRPCAAMTFGLAIEALKAGKSVCRAGWNGKGMFIFLVQGSNDLASIHKYGFGEYLGEPVFRDAIFIKTVDNELVPWTVSQTDALAEDWMVVE